MFRLIAFCAALVLAQPAGADVAMRLLFAYQDPAQAAGAQPTPRLAVTSLLSATPIEVQAPTPGAEGGTSVTVVVPDAAFAGPYARLRLVVDGLRLPASDAKGDQDIQFAFEVLLRRDLLGDTLDLVVPVVTSSRKGALKPYMDLPQVPEDLPGRYLMAEQWMSLYQASPEAVAAAPGSFALHRLISRALVDFSLAMADQEPQAMLLLPSEEMKRTLDLYWNLRSEGGAQHLRAYRDARTTLWKDLPQAETLLSSARRSGVEAAGFCATARRLIDFFAANPPPEDDADWVDKMFPNPGTLQGYIEGRRLDVKASCSRLRI